MTLDLDPSPLRPGPGLYVHVPFCSRACPYCDFDFEVGGPARVEARSEPYFAALEAELDARLPEWGVGAKRPRFDTVYIGGGTPSALGSAGMRRLFACLDAAVDRATAREVTVEVNPEHFDEEFAETLRELGVGRVSLGVQSLATGGLRQLGRVHAREQALAAIELAVSGFDASIDLIVGWPGQSPRELEETLESLLALGPQHLSVYALTIEAGSAWPALVARGQREMPDTDGQAELLARAEARLTRAGLVHYEISNYGRPGMTSLHNAKYWGGVDYLGVGPSAHSARFESGRVIRRGNPRGLDAWASGAPAEVEVLDGEAAGAEALWLGLRQLDGVAVSPFLDRHPGLTRAWLEARVAGEVARGNLEWAVGDRLRLAPGRWLWHDAVGAEIL